MSWYIEALRKYGTVRGRSRRREYWTFVLVNVLVFVVFTAIQGARLGVTVNLILAVVETLFFLAILVPSLTVAIRRLHDTGRSGWWLLIGLVPIIGQIFLLVLFLLDGEPGENRFGPNPKGVVA